MSDLGDTITDNLGAGKLPTILISLAALILIYLDNNGKLAKLAGIIRGNSLNTATAPSAAAPAAAVIVPPGGTAPLPITTKTQTVKVGGVTVTIPAAPPLPGL